MTAYDLQIISVVLTFIYATATLWAIIIGSRQVRTSISISNKEKALDAYIEFSEKYAELSRLSHDIEVRFQKGDKTLQDYDIKFFFNAVWVLQLQEWEFFQARILPVRIFTQWMMHTHEYLLSDKVKSFYGARGRVMTITAKDGFEKYGRRVLRFHPDFIAFIAKLEAIPYAPGTEVAQTFVQVESLVKSVVQDDTYWKI